MLKGRKRDPREAVPPTPTTHHVVRPPAHSPTTLNTTSILRTPQMHRAPLAKPEPDYEVVEFPSEQYVNAKLQPPPPPPPRPPSGHLGDIASCGLCGGGGARVRCAECGRRALCASCDDMYHRHPKRRNHQRQAISTHQPRDERPPLPPKAAPPVPPPRRHKVSASPKPSELDQRRSTLDHIAVLQRHEHTNTMINSLNQHMRQQTPLHLQTKMTTTPVPTHIGSMPFLPTAMPHAPAAVIPPQGHHTLGHLNANWARPRGSLQGFNLHQGTPADTWEPESLSPTGQGWGRPLRRGASVLELGGHPSCTGCVQCVPSGVPGVAGGWRYGSCANLDHPWQSGWPPSCCIMPHGTPHDPRLHQHPHHMPHTPQPQRRGTYDSRSMSRAASRAASRATSPAMSVRSRTSRRLKHRTPSPQPLPSSDADSESNVDSDEPPEGNAVPENIDDSLGPVPPPSDVSWQCEHCTFVNESGVRVCVVCCRTPTVAPKAVTEMREQVEKIKITSSKLPQVVSASKEDIKIEQNGLKKSARSKKERSSIGCGQSPPREDRKIIKPVNRLVTPTREENDFVRTEAPRERHDMAVGPSPPKDVRPTVGDATHTRISLSQENIKSNASSYVGTTEVPNNSPPKVHSISVGPSPPRENTTHTPVNSNTNVQKKSTGTSPPRIITAAERHPSVASKSKVSNTGTSPPPQSISTQTYEVPNSWERTPSIPRSRSRRRFREETRRERSHSRHSLSSDTRESDRSVRTVGASGRWEWRDRDNSPTGDWSESSRLSRRASHLDLRRARPNRRAGYYDSGAASPEPSGATRAASLEALAGAGSRREAERGLELARLMAEAERVGFSAAEVQAALVQSPAAPLAWLRSRWATLCAGVRAAAARLAPDITVSDLEVRAALARHRGAMWPAVTDCVEKHRRQMENNGVGEEGRMRGRVWGSPMGAEAESAPPSSRRSSRARAEDSSDEFDAPLRPKFRDDDWMYLPLDVNVKYTRDADPNPSLKSGYSYDVPPDDANDVARSLKSLLDNMSIDENVLQSLVSDNILFKLGESDEMLNNKLNPFDLVQSENDFIDAYNALTRASPLPTLNKAVHKPETEKHNESVQVNHESYISNENLYLPNDRKIVSESDQRNTNSKDKDMPLKKIPTEVKKYDPVDQKIPNDSKNNIKNDLDGKNHDSLLKNTSLQKSVKPITSNDLEAGLQTEDKSKKLNDLVDNTQKLIQQMKDEINSDINSLDSKNISQSEHESSSNDEQESSYSDTENEDETDNISSEDKDISSSDNETNIQHDTRGTLLVRTSSEDTEQYEEALDNLDTQIKDIKHANIQLLDSISKSLQEDQTFSAEIIKPAVSESTKEDANNNNLFVAVSSFEEIYAELNPTTNNLTYHENDQINITNQEIQNLLPDVHMIAKQAVNISLFKPEAPKKLIIYENVLPVFNAVLENIEKKIINDTEESLSNENPVEKDDTVLNNNTSSENVETSDIITKNVIIKNTVKVENGISSTELENESDTESNGSQQENSTIDITPNVINESTTIVTETDNITTDITNEVQNNINVELYSDHNTKLNAVNGRLNSEGTVNIESATTSTTQVKDVQNIMGYNDNVENDQENVSESLTIISSLNNRETVDLTHENLNFIDENSDSNVKLTGVTDHVSTKNSLKSNIPKPVKAIQNNNKLKNEKNTPKFVASKVPIRRTSLKQYPAPSPPKSHFGNIQSGHVKQLQTRLFNVKTKTDINTSESVEVKPTTSTMSKKKPAPPPPQQQHTERATTTPNELPIKDKKKNYFRETCRTEDEWTDSDSDDSQIQIRKPTEEEPSTPLSPPPPITLRRVSGQFIDLAKIRLPEGSPERQARMLLAEGATETWEQAQLAVELISQGTEPSAALMAALECTDLDAAFAYLHQDCELCASRLPEHEMVSMLRCTHRCCRECARHYFIVQITERSIADCVCPYCKVPDLENLPEDAWLEYFAHLDILLKTLLGTEIHELFQRKLRDRTLARDPNFRWCMECASGFFVHPKQKKVRCPECRAVSCASCRKQWTPNHEGLTCEQYTTWLEDNDPERSVSVIQQHLRDNGIECPRCHFKYSLSRGGCMHFTCTQCKFEFCYGCGKPFTMGARCGLSEYCAKLGLHAHHPRNCLFYLRDKEPHELQTLLQMNNVKYETEAEEGTGGRCPIQLQRETPTGLVDGTCGSEAPTNYAGLCKAHYVEYLAGLARGLDPIPIMDVTELVAELRRRALPLPERGPWDTDPIYAGMCAEIVKDKIPLD